MALSVLSAASLRPGVGVNGVSCLDNSPEAFAVWDELTDGQMGMSRADEQTGRRWAGKQCHPVNLKSLID